MSFLVRTLTAPYISHVAINFSFLLLLSEHITRIEYIRIHMRFTSLYLYIHIYTHMYHEIIVTYDTQK